MREMILRMFMCRRMPPSAIDNELGLVKGTAHDIIVEHWSWEEQ